MPPPSGGGIFDFSLFGLPLIGGSFFYFGFVGLPRSGGLPILRLSGLAPGKIIPNLGPNRSAEAQSLFDENRLLGSVNVS